MKKIKNGVYIERETSHCFVDFNILIGAFSAVPLLTGRASGYSRSFTTSEKSKAISLEIFFISILMFLVLFFKKKA